MPAPRATGRSTPYQAFGALYNRVKKITDDHGKQPYVAPMLSRRDTTRLSLKTILNLLRAVGKPSAHEIDKAKRAALKTVHPDLLMGSPELISDPAGLEICPLGLVDLVGAWFANRSEVEDLEARSFLSLRLSVRATNGCLPWSSITFLIRSYNTPKAWYGVGRPFAIGAGVSLLLVVCRW